MKRSHPDVVAVVDTPALPAAPARVIAALEGHVTPARLGRMWEVARRRSRRLVPVLERLSNPHNVSAVLRSAEAFGLDEVHIIPGEFGALGAKNVSRRCDQWLSIRCHSRTEDALASLKARGYRVLVASMEGTVTPEMLEGEQRTAIVFGNERLGPSAEARAASDGGYAIPMVGFVESLNVSVAAALTFHAATARTTGELDGAAHEEIVARFLMATVDRAAEIVRDSATSATVLPSVQPGGRGANG